MDDLKHLKPPQLKTTPAFNVDFDVKKQYIESPMTSNFFFHKQKYLSYTETDCVTDQHNKSNIEARQV